MSLKYPKFQNYYETITSAIWIFEREFHTNSEFRIIKVDFRLESQVNFYI